MLRSRFVAWMLLAGMMVFTARVGFGQNYPNKPIRIVTIEAGGSGDFTARIVGPAISSSWGQPVIIDNRPASLTAEMVAKAPSDGYTLLFYGTPMWTTSLLQNTAYDPVRDFSPVTLMTSSPNILVVHPSVPANSVRELIALAKAKPGELNYAANATGSAPHLAGELFKAMAGVNMVAIPYKGGGPAIVALLGGQVQLIFGSAASVAPYIKSGKLKALAVTSTQPSALFPGLPTVAASGVPGYESGSAQGAWAPAKTPAVVINRLNQEIVRILNSADAKEKFFNGGIEVVGSSPEQFAAFIKSEIAKWGRVIKIAGIKAD